MTSNQSELQFMCQSDIYISVYSFITLRKSSSLHSYFESSCYYKVSESSYIDHHCIKRHIKTFLCYFHNMKYLIKNKLNLLANYFIYNQILRIERMYDSQMKFILILNLKENFELFKDQMRDIVLIVFKNKISQMKRIYVKFMLEK